MDCYVLEWCRSTVFESMNDWMTDEWDLIQLQSIKLGLCALRGDVDAAESNELIMMIDWSDLPSLSSFKGTGCNFLG